MRWLLVLALSALALAQEKPPTPQAKARELLDSAARMVGATNLETNVIALMHLGDAMTKLDRVAGSRYLREAFSATPGLSAELKPSLQTEIVRKLAAVDPPAAAELVRVMAEPGKVYEGSESAASAVVKAFLEKQDFDHAIEVLNLIPDSAEFPFAAAQAVFEKLPKDDSRRTTVFGRSTEAYRQHSTGPYTEFLEKHWKDVPRSLAQQGLGAVVNAGLKADDETKVSETLESEKGNVTLGSRQAIEYFRLIELIRELDPGRIDEILKAYPDVKNALQKFPGGRGSVKADMTIASSVTKDNSSFNASASATSGGDDDPFGPSIAFAMSGGLSASLANPEKMQDYLRQVNEVAQKAEAAIAEKDVRKAIAKALEIPMEGLRADALAILAKRSKDPATLEKSMLVLGDIKDPGQRLPAWISVAEAADELKDDKLVRVALERAFADARRMLSVDTDAEKPNLAPRDVWPSVQASRLTAFTAGKLLGVTADELLPVIDETDLAVLARIEMARQLLGLPLSMHSIQFRR